MAECVNCGRTIFPHAGGFANEFCAECASKFKEQTRVSCPPASQTRALSPILFLLISLCFVFPWIDISCQGERVVSMTGIELMTGKVIQGNDRIEPQIMAIVTAACVVIGLMGTMLAQGRDSHRIAVVLGIGTALSILLLKWKLESDIRAEVTKGSGGGPAPMIVVDAVFGYWAAFILAAAIVAANLWIVATSPPQVHLRSRSNGP